VALFAAPPSICVTHCRLTLGSWQASRPLVSGAASSAIKSVSQDRIHCYLSSIARCAHQRRIS
jgi:hypothetical protein